MGEQPKVVWSPYTKGYFENPYEHLKECRDTNPVHKGVHGEWMFFRYKDVYEIIRSNKFGVSELSQYFAEKEPQIFQGSGCPYLAKGTKKWAMYLNGEDHKNVRAVMGKAFKAFDLATIIPEAIDDTNSMFKDEAHFDLVTYCSYFIYGIIKRFYSLPESYSFEEVKKYSNMVARSQDLFVPKSVYREMNDWFLKGNTMFSEGLNDPLAGYTQNLISISKKSGLDYQEEDILSILAVSLMAAFETSKDSLSIALLELMKSDDLLDTVLEANDSALNMIIEELFRFTAPLQYTVRVSNTAVSCAGQEIPANAKVYICLASANRDPEVFHQPDELLLSREKNNHLSFGAGLHTCAGAFIARQEMKYCLKPMIELLKNYRIDTNQKPIYARQIMMRTIESAPVIRRSDA